MTARMLLGCWAALSSSGCYLLTSPELSYRTNREVLERAARDVGYVVDSELFALQGVDLREDSVTLQYRGVAHVGDTAWVVRFSVKSTEQDPDAIADVYPLLRLLAEGRSGFDVVEEGETTVVEHRARFVRYRFDSPVHGADSRPMEGHGIVLTLRSGGEEDPLVYHVKLDNHGDRDDVGWPEVAPFLEPLDREGRSRPDLRSSP